MNLYRKNFLGYFPTNGSRGMDQRTLDRGANFIAVCFDRCWYNSVHMHVEIQSETKEISKWLYVDRNSVGAAG